MPSVDPYPFPCQTFWDDSSARALPQVPTVPSQRRENIRELAPTTSNRYRSDQQGQTLPSAMPSYLVSHHTTSEAFVAPSVLSENPLVRGISFTNAAEDNSGNQRSSYSLCLYPADTVSAGPVSISAASTASGSRFMPDPQNVENLLGQPDTTCTLDSGT